MLLEYKERYAWPLTSTTTCYSGARHRSNHVVGEGGTPAGSDGGCQENEAKADKETTSYTDNASSSGSGRFQLATELHTIAVDIPLPVQQRKGEADQDEEICDDDVVDPIGGESRTRGQRRQKRRQDDPRCPEFRWKDVVSVEGDRATAGGGGGAEFYCVGYSSLGYWEALVLMDRREAVAYGQQSEDEDLRAAILSQQRQQQQQQQQQHTSSSTSLLQQQHRHQRTSSSSLFSVGGGDAQTGAASISDDASTTVVTSATTTAGGGAGSSSSVISMTTAAAGPAAHQQHQQLLPEPSDATVGSEAMNYGGSGSGASLHHHARSASSMPSLNINSNGSGTEEIQSKILLRNNKTDMEYSVGLDCRGACPTLCRVGGCRSGRLVGNNEEDHGEVVGLWLGSPDNNSIQFWRPAQNTPALNKVDLDDPAFRFVSPVMALDCSCHCCNHDSVSSCTSDADSAMHCLAVACQDGTIRIVNFNWENFGDAISNLLETTVIVDGPLVCASLQRVLTSDENGGTTMHALFGSLCGYVCELWLPPSRTRNDSDHGATAIATSSNSSAKSGGGYWDGPLMVAEGYWNSRLRTEDPVVAVCAHGNQVAVGTHSGLCMVYVRVQNEYDLHWTCRLPYSIHGLCFVDWDKDGCVETTNGKTIAQPQLVVTTRRSIHIFERQDDGLRHFDAEVAKSRLEKMLEERGIITACPDEVSCVANEEKRPESRQDTSVAASSGEEVDLTTTIPTVHVKKQEAKDIIESKASPDDVSTTEYAPIDPT